MRTVTRFGGVWFATNNGRRISTRSLPEAIAFAMGC